MIINQRNFRISVFPLNLSSYFSVVQCSKEHYPQQVQQRANRQILTVSYPTIKHIFYAWYN